MDLWPRWISTNCFKGVKRDFEIVSVLRELVFPVARIGINSTSNNFSRSRIGRQGFCAWVTTAFVLQTCLCAYCTVLSSTCWKLMEDADGDYDGNRNKDMRLMR